MNLVKIDSSQRSVSRLYIQDQKRSGARLTIPEWSSIMMGHVLCNLSCQHGESALPLKTSKVSVAVGTESLMRCQITVQVGGER